MALSAIEQRLAAEGLDRYEDVRKLVHVRRLAKACREAQQKYFAYRGTDPKVKRQLRESAIAAESRLDKSLSEETTGQGGLGI